MRTRAHWHHVVTLASIVIWSACDFIRPPDPLESHPDVVTVVILLVAGESQARLLAVHPHRPTSGEVPNITATLEGPGWRAPFLDDLTLDACTSTPDWPGPVRCLGATLPEPIQAGTAYGIEGSAPLGSFKGAMTVPRPPVLVEPGDTLEVDAEKYSDVDIPIRYSLGADVGTVLADVRDAYETLEDGTEVELDLEYLFPLLLDTADEAHTVTLFYTANPLRFSLNVLGIGRNYTNFRRHAGSFPLPQPWPSFGIEGEGVYGYFDGLAPSRIARVWIR